ncbi:oligosaccharide flippase family protein [Providencia rettgeri]|uniref:lipopolysaccharide biosynthesis protein n=2 Tax=Providencia rettgeri TaxID=587 RepID=UPI0013E05045|nr:oligosaccharide flippase family protein [Providencia rettgeri]
MIIKNSFLYFITKLISAILSFILIILLTRYLGDEQFGKYTQVQSLSLLIGSALFLPLTASITRFFPIEENKNELLRNIYFLYGIISIMVFCVGSIFLTNQKIELYLLVSLFIISKGLHDLNLEINRASLSVLRYSIQTLTQIITLLSSIYILSYFSIIELNWENTFILIIISYVISSLIYTHKFRIQKVNKQKIIEYFSYSKSLFLIYLLGFSFQLIDRQIIAYYLPDSKLAYYSVFYSLSQSILILMISSFSMVCYPLLVKHYQTALFEDNNKKLFYLTFGFSIPILFGYVSISKELIILFFNENYYIELKNIIWPIALGIFNIAIAANYFDFSFKLAKKNEKQIYVFIIPLTIIIAGNLIFIEQYGLVASALSFLIATLVLLMTTFILGRKYCPLFIDYNYILIVSFCSFLMYYLLKYVSIENIIYNFILKIIIGIFIYFTLTGIYIWKKIK